MTTGRTVRIHGNMWAALPAGLSAGAVDLQQRVDRLPIVILHAHSDCNCRCAMCDIWKTRSHREVPIERVRAWLPELRSLGVERVVLTGGEPLMHSGFPELLALLRGAGLAVTVLSSGLLVAHQAEALVRFADEIIVSLDGPALLHDAIRGVPRAFERLAEGVGEIRRRAGRALPIKARCTVQRANCEHLVATVDAARSIGLDGLSFLAVDTHTEAFERTATAATAATGRLSELLPTSEQLPTLAAEIAALEGHHAEAFATGYIAERPDKLRRRLLQYFRATLGEAPFPGVDCNAPWLSMVVETDGTVRPCFFHRPYARLGDTDAANAFDAILNGPAALAWRGRLDVRADATCQRCVCNLVWKDPAGSA